MPALFLPWPCSQAEQLPVLYNILLVLARAYLYSPPIHLVRVRTLYITSYTGLRNPPNSLYIPIRHKHQYNVFTERQYNFHELTKRPWISVLARSQRLRQSK
jgi:hypothetical protein